MRNFDGPEDSDIKQLLAGKKIVIAEKTGRIGSPLADTITQLGTRNEDIVLISDLFSPQQLLLMHRPHMVFCNYATDHANGLGFLDAHCKVPTNGEARMFMFMADTAAQSAVALSIDEEMVDGCLSEPITKENLRSLLWEATQKRLEPNEYRKTIAEGKKFLQDNRTNEAITSFTKAVDLNEKPTLALYYLGKAYQGKASFDSAEQSYARGVSLCKTHLACLTGLYEVQTMKRHYDEAYDTLRKTTIFFPGNQERLSAALRLSIKTEKFEDVESYYQAFCKINNRSLATLKHMCAALVVCGKFYLRTKVPSRAMDLLSKSAELAGDSFNIYREIFNTLYDYGKYKDAQEMLQHVPENFKTSNDIRAALFAIKAITQKFDVLGTGKKLLAAGVSDIMIYRAMIRFAVEAGQQNEAKELYAEALKLWPQASSEIAKFLDPVSSAKTPARSNR